MIAATIFSGIGAPEVAMPDWEWVWHAEIDKFANTVMAKRHPRSLNLGDVNGSAFVERAERAGRPTTIVFGSPCQSFSVAGRRLGLDDPRGNLALVALGIVARLKPTWFVFENVPGLLSSDGGRDWGIFLRTVDELGYCGAWAVLDAQWFGLAQRRERVFFVGHAGNWRGPAAVLFEPEGLRGDSPPRREAGQRIAPTLEARTDGGGAGWGTDFLADGGMTVAPDIAWALQERDHKGVDSDTKDGHLIVTTPVAVDLRNSAVGDVAMSLQGGGMGEERGRCINAIPHVILPVADPVCANEGRTYTHEGRNKFRLRNVVPVLEAGARAGREGHEAKDGLGIGADGDPMFSLQGKQQHAVAINSDPLSAPGSAVRRLTPRECERLQGFPDDYTQVTYRGKPAADGPRFKALGNSMAVPVVRWILGRIEMFHVKHCGNIED
jgi:DNA (cytosine-5)-methyltransferase 1